MARFYGQVEGQASTVATCRGSDYIKVSAQSWNGSLITDMKYKGEQLIIRLQIDDGSSPYGETYFIGTLQQLKDRLAGVR